MTPSRARDGNLSDELAPPEQAMSGQKKGGSDGRSAGGGGYTKRGKPRPGTGGYRKDRLEGKGPTPPASAAPGSSRAARGGRGGPGPSGPARASGAMNAPESAGTVRNTRKRTRPRAAAAKDRKWSQAGTRLSSHCGPGFQRWPCTSPAGRTRTSGSRSPCSWRRRRASPCSNRASELDRLTGGAIHQGVALRVRPYEYAHPEDLSDGPGGSLPLIVALDGVTDPRNLGAVIRRPPRSARPASWCRRAAARA